MHPKLHQTPPIPPATIYRRQAQPELSRGQKAGIDFAPTLTERPTARRPLANWMLQASGGSAQLWAQKRNAWVLSVSPDARSGAEKIRSCMTRLPDAPTTKQSPVGSIGRVRINFLILGGLFGFGLIRGVFRGSTRHFRHFSEKPRPN